MQIQSGKLYENRTWKYLYPCLKYYGSSLTAGLSNFFKLAVGVGDINNQEEVNCIYILIDTNLALTDKQRQDYKERFAKFLDWISYQDYYINDYIYDSDSHMIVLKLPTKYSDTYINFVKGEYSKMYNLAEVRDYFSYITNMKNKDLQMKQNAKLKATKSVLSKDKNYIQTFVDKVNKDFNTQADISCFQEAELDYPPKKQEEIFNFKEGEGI